MDKSVFDKIWQAREILSRDPEYQNLVQEHILLNARFLKQVETMNPQQREAVWDYCGLLIEMHLRTLEIALSDPEKAALPYL